MSMIERASFSIDSIPDETFSGFTDGREWNGWACPYFQQEETERILHLSEANGFRWYYDRERDAYIVSTEQDSANDAPEIFERTSILIDGNIVAVYPLGAASWIWEIAENME